ncbi:MAG: two-component system chemotaxis response regulator CheY [Planctomycetota bacterium]|jgi:two-component system chemotaxis response regulator CheY
MKILICDDSMAMRRIVLRSLRQAGYDDHEIIEAENGKEGLEATQEKAPDLILCDWNMPVMTGIEFLEALRATGDTTPFGFITTEQTMDFKKRAIGAGANFLLPKPFTPEQMDQKVSGILK